MSWRSESVDGRCDDDRSLHLLTPSTSGHAHCPRGRAPGLHVTPSPPPYRMAPRPPLRPPTPVPSFFDRSSPSPSPPLNLDTEMRFPVMCRGWTIGTPLAKRKVQSARTLKMERWQVATSSHISETLAPSPGQSGDVSMQTDGLSSPLKPVSNPSHCASSQSECLVGQAQSLVNQGQCVSGQGRCPASHSSHSVCLSNQIQRLTNHNQCLSEQISCLLGHTSCESNHSSCLSNHRSCISDQIQLLSTHIPCLSKHGPCPCGQPQGQPGGSVQASCLCRSVLACLCRHASCHASCSGCSLLPCGRQRSLSGDSATNEVPQIAASDSVVPPAPEPPRDEPSFLGSLEEEEDAAGAMERTICLQSAASLRSASLSEVEEHLRIGEFSAAPRRGTPLGVDPNRDLACRLSGTVDADWAGGGRLSLGSAEEGDLLDLEDLQVVWNSSQFQQQHQQPQQHHQQPQPQQQQHPQQHQQQQHPQQQHQPQQPQQQQQASWTEASTQSFGATAEYSSTPDIAEVLGVARGDQYFTLPNPQVTQYTNSIQTPAGNDLGLFALENIYSFEQGLQAIGNEVRMSEGTQCDQQSLCPAATDLLALHDAPFLDQTLPPSGTDLLALGDAQYINTNQNLPQIGSDGLGLENARYEEEKLPPTGNEIVALENPQHAEETLSLTVSNALLYCNAQHVDNQSLPLTVSDALLHGNTQSLSTPNQSLPTPENVLPVEEVHIVDRSQLPAGNDAMDLETPPQFTAEQNLPSVVSDALALDDFQHVYDALTFRHTEQSSATTVTAPDQTESSLAPSVDMELDSLSGTQPGQQVQDARVPNSLDTMGDLESSEEWKEAQRFATLNLLRNKVMERRKNEGRLDLPDTTFTPRSEEQPAQLTKEEIEKMEKKKFCNRISARKSRRKKNQEAVKKTEEIEALEQRNSDLRKMVQDLEEQIGYYKQCLVSRAGKLRHDEDVSVKV